MALTERGAIATDQLRRRQMAIATNADSALRRAWARIDLNNLDRNRLAWQRDIAEILSANYGLEANAAENYLSEYRFAELGTTSGPVVRPPIDLAGDIASMDATAIVGTKARIATGTVDPVAFEQARQQMMDEAHRLIIAGARGTITESSAADSRIIGWRRKSDGDPCAFCAMLVSRGPSYLSQASALSNPNAAQGWIGATGRPDPYHHRCACTVEPVYGDWKPTEAEQVYVDAYYDAAEEATDAGSPRTAATVLHRMRDSGDFKDSPSRRRINYGPNT